ncbi:MAG: low-specificity L-threonine aldolase [Deltaproteobacteria bacterium]|nr:low-specificity L-threonine aldolase [Deltaproteobacteria bacterium]MBI3388907.1 low-specificity L-threonine aldolase [Deltaproteobacteria bacterium]
MKTIDLRSDTVTKPTPAMRAAMAGAEVGDDVYGEDPTVNELQRVAAQRLGKEAAIFVPSGTMANQLAIRALTHHGEVMLASDGAHILKYESGAAAALAGVQTRSIGSGGVFDADDVHAGVSPGDHHYAPTTVVAIENTHNTAGGRVFPFEQLQRVVAAARAHGLKLHLDGARLFNAVVASGIPAATWAEPFDTVSFCLSKGLGAPIGSLVCGSAEVIDRVHRFRKMYGGGMRQAGILAAAGLYALEHHVDRLADDHRNARRLADGLTRLGLVVDPAPETNIVLFHVNNTMEFLRSISVRQLLMNPVSAQVFRAVTHLDVSTADIDEALTRIGDALKK